jgi:hypothetical protein
MPVDSGQFRPEDIERRKRLAAALMASARPGPVGSHMQGLGNLANAGVNAMAMRELMKKAPTGM